MGRKVRMNKEKILKSVSASVPYTLGLSILAILLFRALELRLPGITRNFWQDEMQHNFAVIHPTHLKWMLQLVSSMQQPFLDFFLRKWKRFYEKGHCVNWILTQNR